jgi:predicted methyltransferase MtxX (methanogen marker protein 4)
MSWYKESKTGSFLVAIGDVDSGRFEIVFRFKISDFATKFIKRSIEKNVIGDSLVKAMDENHILLEDSEIARVT